MPFGPHNVPEWCTFVSIAAAAAVAVDTQFVATQFVAATRHV